MNRRKLARLFLLCLTALCFLTAEAAAAMETVRVAYPSMNTSVFCLMLAQKQGYLKEEGMDLQLLSIRGEIAIRTVLAGDVDFFTNAGSALAAGVRAVPVKIVTVFQDKPSWDLIAQPDIKSIGQLRGKNVGIMSPEGSLAVVAREIFKRNGIDPAKDVNLIVMGGDSVRYPALQTGSIQATLFNTGMSIQAQKDGFTKLASAGDYANLIEGGLATSDQKIKDSPDKVFRFIRASLKGLHYFLAKPDAAVSTMMQGLRMEDHQLAKTIYDLQSRLTLRDGYTQDKVLLSMIDSMKKATKVERNIKVADIFDLDFVKKADQELKDSGWKP